MERRIRPSQRKRRVRPSQAAGSQTATTKTAPAALPLPRRAKINYPGHALHGKVVTVVTEELEFPWRHWKLGHKVEVRAEGYRHLILLSIENIQEIETPTDT